MSGVIILNREGGYERDGTTDKIKRRERTELERVFSIFFDTISDDAGLGAWEEEMPVYLLRLIEYKLKTDAIVGEEHING